MKRNIFSFGPMLLVLSVLATAANWVKMGSFWGDAARSIGEMYRASLGERPYVDFSFPYPPASPFFFGIALRSLGATFENLQILYSLLSAACVLCFWMLARRLFASREATWLSVSFLVFGATSGGAFALYSLQMFAPAMFFGVAGLLLALCGILDLQRRNFGAPTYVWLSAGSFMAMTGKAEAVAGVAAAFGIYLLYGWRRGSWPLKDFFREAILPGAALCLPPALLFLYLFRQTDATLLREGLGGYGLATATCTWWPSGFAILGGLVAFSTALALTCYLQALGSWRAGSAFLPWFLGAIAFSLPWATYTWAFFPEIVSQQAIRQGPLAVAYLMVTTNSVLLPILWSALLVSPFLLIANLSRAKRFSRWRFQILLLSAAIVAISARTLFGSLMSYVTQTSPVAYPLLFAALPLIVLCLGAWLGKKFGQRLSPSAGKRLHTIAVTFLIAFSAVRIASYAAREFRLSYQTLQTNAGTVRVSDASAVEVWRFFAAQEAGEIADLAYGGALQFALHRRNPLFTTQFAVFRPSVAHRQRDLDFLAARPARFAITPPDIRLEYGAPAFACSFPEFRWRQEAYPPPKETFPVVAFLQQHYRRVLAVPGYEVYEWTEQPALAKPESKP